jgi:hypothetical protein
MALPTDYTEQAAVEQPAAEKPVSVMDSLQQERAKLYQIQAELMKQIEERSKPDSSAFWAAMARGFGNPNTPSFAGGAAGFAGNLQAAQEEERKRAIETAQMRMQLGQSQLAMKEKEAGIQMLQGLTGQQPATVAPQGIPQGAAQGSASGFRNITGTDIAKLSMLAPDVAKALETGIKLDQERWKISQNGIVFDTRTNQYLNIPIPGQEQKAFTTPYGTFQMTPYDFSQFQMAQRQGKGKEWIENYRSSGIPSPTTETGMLSEEERRAREAGLTEKAKEESKYSTDVRSGIFTSADAASKLSGLAQSNLQLVKDNPDAVGVLAAPGIGQAIIGVLGKARITSGTSGASADIDTSSLEDAIRKVGPSKMAGETQAAYDARRQRNIDAALQISRNLAEMELYFAKSYLKGQGSVSNMERNITKALGGNISDSKNALMAKNELLIKTAEFDEKIRDAYKAWQKKNPSEGAENFKGSEEEKNLRNAYNEEIKSLNAKYFSAKSSGTTASKDVQDLRTKLRQQMGF